MNSEYDDENITKHHLVFLKIFFFFGLEFFSSFFKISSTIINDKLSNYIKLNNQMVQ